MIDAWSSVAEKQITLMLRAPRSLYCRQSLCENASSEGGTGGVLETGYRKAVRQGRFRLVLW